MAVLSRFLAAACVIVGVLPRITAGPASVVLLGPSGSGKSQTGNTLLAEARFSVSGGLESETIVPQTEVVNFGGREWQVVDTPGYFDTSRTAEELDLALAKFSSLVSDHIVALAFVVPYGRFGDAHLRGWRLMRDSFGSGAMKHTLLVFTACGDKTEQDILAETSRLCSKDPPPMLCSVLQDLGLPDVDRLVAFGRLDAERQDRDRTKLFAVAGELERAAGGKGYDHGDFLRRRERRKLLQQRISAVEAEEDRKLLEMMLANVESGAQSDQELVRRLEQAEGLGETERITVDFEDRTLGPFKKLSGSWRQPMPVPYNMMRGYGAAGEGGNLFLHTGTDSGVRIRQGDQRTGELRSEAFILGRGDIAWEATGSGGFLAVCPADEGSQCVERHLRRQSESLAHHSFEEDELSELVGSSVYLRLVDDRKNGWGFLALDNLVYPVLSGPPPTTKAPTATPTATRTEPPTASPTQARYAAEENTTATLEPSTSTLTLTSSVTTTTLTMGTTKAQDKLGLE